MGRIVVSDVPSYDGRWLTMLLRIIDPELLVRIVDFGQLVAMTYEYKGVRRVYQALDATLVPRRAAADAERLARGSLPEKLRDGMKCCPGRGPHAGKSNDLTGGHRIPSPHCPGSHSRRCLTMTHFTAAMGCLVIDGEQTWTFIFQHDATGLRLNWKPAAGRSRLDRRSPRTGIQRK